MHQRVESVPGRNIVEDQEYTNPFEDVHRRAKAFKDRAREANKNDAERRESRLVQEAKEILGKEPK
jgi:hypothetical protein